MNSEKIKDLPFSKFLLDFPLLRSCLAGSLLFPNSYTMKAPNISQPSEYLVSRGIDPQALTHCMPTYLENFNLIIGCLQDLDIQVNWNRISGDYIQNLLQDVTIQGWDLNIERDYIAEMAAILKSPFLLDLNVDEMRKIQERFDEVF